MKEILSQEVSLLEKAAWIREHGQLIDAQDYYSFFVLVYIVEKERVRLLYNFSEELISVECDDEVEKDDFITNQLQYKI